MTEFDKSWQGWKLKTDVENLEDRIKDPEGGIALIETGIDAHRILRAAERNVEKFVDNDKSERSHYYNGKYTPSTHRLSGGIVQRIPHLRPVVRELCIRVHDIEEPLIESLHAPWPQLRGSYWNRSSFQLAFQKHIRIRRVHTDFDCATVWLGATQPALEVQVGDDWLDVPDVPTGHALVWRGNLAHDGETPLAPVHHSVTYRSAIRRLVMFS